MKITAVAMAFAIPLIFIGPRLRAADLLVVHEWGTFTSFQDEAGRAIGGINTDDEPVPGFVHRVGSLIGDSNIPTGYSQGIPTGDPDVTMRLETPVIYFHRAPGQPQTTVHVDVAFHGGWLTEFYPSATFTAPGITQPNGSDGGYHYGPLNSKTVGTLNWPEVHVGGAGTPPVSDQKVWTTPRNAASDLISVGDESEKFLFYRGVGHVDAPLVITRGPRDGQLQIHLSNGLSKRESAALAHSPMWLVRVSPDGWVDWNRGYSPAESASNSVLLGVMDSRFLKTDAHPTGIESLHKDMATALAKAGLVPDEAEAMLNTWQVSYFKSPGLRLFFLVPRSWIDGKLPLHVSGNTAITRVMVGRIEIMTAEQEQLVKTIEAGPYPAPTKSPDVYAVEKRLAAGEPLESTVKDFPPDLRAYLLLGRFRDALLIDQQNRHPNAVLAKFIALHGIRSSAGQS